MNWNNNTKTWVALLAAITCMGLCKEFQMKHNNEMLVGGVTINKGACAYAINFLVPGAVDSSKACECFLPAFYEIIKDNPLLVDQFREQKSFFTLPDSLQHIYEQQFAKCIRDNIIDSHAILMFSPENAEKFKQKIKLGLEQNKQLTFLDGEAVSNCILEKLNGHITVVEYFSMQKEGNTFMDSIFLTCVGRISK